MIHSLEKLRRILPRDQRVLYKGLTFFGVLAVCCFVLSWQRYPVQNGFSIFRNTLSHLGSPDAHRNPGGYRFFRLGFCCICVLMGCAVIFRHYRMRGLEHISLTKNTRCYLCGITCFMATIFLPDSRALFLDTVRFQILHGGTVIVGIIFLAFGILFDALLLRRLSLSRCFRLGAARWSLPFSAALTSILFLLGLFTVGLVCLGVWELRCAFDPTLPHWPGQGVFSTPLWEWIMFFSLVVFMCLFPRLLPDCSANPQQNKKI